MYLSRKPVEASNAQGDLLPHGRIEATEVDQFLEFIFSEVARKPAELRLKEVSAVVRYMCSLVVQGLPRKVLAGGTEAIAKYALKGRSAEAVRCAEATWRMAKTIWWTVMLHGRITPSSQQEALRFMKRHEKDYLANPNFGDAMKFINAFGMPSNAAPAGIPPHLASELLSAQGEGNPHLADDLTERMAAASCVLRQAGVKNIASRIAKVLDASDATRIKDSSWGADEVRARIKTYVRRKEAMAPDQLADLWIFYWRCAEEVRKENSANSYESSSLAEPVRRD